MHRRPFSPSADTPAHFLQRLCSPGVVFMALLAVSGATGCATTQTPPAEKPADTSTADTADRDAATSTPLRHTAGAISFEVPAAYRVSGPDDKALARETVGKRRVAIVVPKAWPVGAVTPLEQFFVINTAQAFFTPLTEATCESVAEVEATKIGTKVSDVRFVATPAGPACYFTDQPATKRQYVGFIDAAGRIISVISGGTSGVAREDYEALLKSMRLPNPSLVVGNRLDGQLPDGFLLIENKEIDPLGGIFIQANAPGPGGKKVVRAIIFAFPLPMFVPAEEWAKENACTEYGESNATSKKKTLKVARSYAHPRGTTCEAITVADAQPTVLDRTYIVPFKATIVGVTCNYDQSDSEMEKACTDFGNTLEVVAAAQ